MNNKRIFSFLLVFIICLFTVGCSKNKASNQTATSTINHRQKRRFPDPIKQKIKKMSLNEKIGQLYFIHSNGDFQQNLQLIRHYKIGGLALFAPDFENRSKAEFQSQIRRYQQASRFGLFIGTDQEGGSVSRINTNPLISKEHFPSPQKIYQTSGMAGIKAEERKTAKLLRENGINNNFAPVADVAKNKNSFIFDRTLGKNYLTTAKYVSISVKAIQSQKVAASLKHFPGYGDAADTHTGFAQIDKSLANYQKEDLVPFKAGIKAGVDEIMVSHIIINSLDNYYPASLSKKAHQFLRKNMNYSGIIISDDLEMVAITKFCQNHHLNADAAALQAGNDLLLGGHPQTGTPAIKRAINDHKISENQIDKSVYRILKLKQKLGILK